MENNINISELNKTLQENYIHYDPSRVDFTINNLELNLLEQSGNNLWKDVFFVTLGLGLPSLMNGVSGREKLQASAAWTEDIFLNFLIAGISLSICILSLIVWQKNKLGFKKIIQQIKDKPKYKLPHR